MQTLKKQSQALDLAQSLGQGNCRAINGAYRTKCPAHHDNELSLIIRDAPLGPQVQCQAGCTTAQIRNWIIVALSAPKLTPVTSITRQERIKRSLVAIKNNTQEICSIAIDWLEWKISELTER